MADLTITAANVASGAGAVKVHGTAGASITAGQAVYLDASDERLKLTDANGASAGMKDVYGVALHAAAAGQPLTVQRGGSITIGGTVTAGTIYVASATPGGIAPAADLASGHTVSIIGVATSASVIALAINNSGAALA